MQCQEKSEFILGKVNFCHDKKEHQLSLRMDEDRTGGWWMQEHISACGVVHEARLD